jgi:hypothetical protein
MAREGEQTLFRVQIDGTAPLFAQWQKNGEPIPGANGLSFTTAPLTLGDNGNTFSVVVTNSSGDVTSSNAVLTVTDGIAIALSANHSGEPVLYPGWPLVLEVALIHPDLFDSNAVPILISATNGPWFNALRIEIRNALDQPETWPFHPAPFTNEIVQLDADSGGRMLWWLAPVETLPLPAGDFKITATLNTTNVTRPGAWKGLLRGVPVSLSISNGPPLVDEILEEQKRRLFADYARLQGNPAQAQTEIDALLNAYPTNIGGLTYNAYLKQDARLFDAAFQSIQLALDQAAIQSPHAPEPPAELLRLEADLLQIVAPPMLQSKLAEQQLLISWEGHPVLFSYRLEASPDLISWSTLTTNFTVISNRFSATANLTPQRRFFRVIR